MKLSSRTKYYITESICLLYILLFIYASASKLLDFQHFRIQLGQSPLLSAFAGQVAIIVPVAEIFICVLLLIPKYKPAGLFAAYGLMVMFTAYIFIILNYTSFVPCSCGGVLEKLDWQSHLVFNLFFILLAVLGVILYNAVGNKHSPAAKKRRLTGFLALITVAGIGIVSLLFVYSENIIHYHNRLTRRFPHSPIKQDAILNLNINSYYIAGTDGANVFLGNVTAPLVITTLNRKLIEKKENRIELDRKDLPFRGLKVSVLPPYFFVADGTVPCIFKGKIDNWRAELAHQNGEFFTTTVPIDSAAVAVSTNSKKTGDNILGVIRIGNQNHTILNPQVLQKQFDGVFDTDGHILYSNGMQSIIYLYAYRNQFTVTDKKLKIKARGTTLDTISHAKLSIAEDQKYRQRKFAKPPLFVNKSSAVYKNLLFVNSAVPGLYEDDRMWKRTSIIDVYDLTRGSYMLSFTIDDYNGKKLKNFVVHNDHLYGLIGNYIITYKIDSQITLNYNK